MIFSLLLFICGCLCKFHWKCKSRGSVATMHNISVENMHQIGHQRRWWGKVNVSTRSTSCPLNTDRQSRIGSGFSEGMSKISHVVDAVFKPDMGTSQFFIRFNSVSKSQLMTHIGFTRIDSNQLTNQNGSLKFDSNRLATQKASRIF